METINFKKWLEVKELTVRDVSNEIGNAVKKTSGQDGQSASDEVAKVADRLGKDPNAGPEALAAIANVDDAVNKNSKENLQQRMSKKMKKK